MKPASPASGRVRRHGLGARVASLWSRALAQPSALILANTALQSILRMGSNIVLARLLAPDAFALIALTTLILTGMQMVSDVGIGLTALREGNLSREDEHKLWTMNLLRGGAVTVAVLAAAAPIGWISGDAEIGKVLAALALIPLMTGLQSLYPIMAMGRRQLLPTTLLEVGSRVIGIAGSVLIALVIPNVWALVIGTTVGYAFSTIGGFLIAGYGPRVIIDWRYIARQWQFARWIQAASTLSFLAGQIDKPLFPVLFGMTALGVYGIGASLALMPSQITGRWTSNVFYPLTAQLLRHGGEARALLLRVRTSMLLYTAVMTLTMVGIAPVFFVLLYKPQYWAAAGFAQILALGVFFDTAESSLRHMPLVEATSRYEVLAVCVRLLAFAAALGVVVMLKGNAFAYALAVAVAGLVAHLFMLAVCTRRGYLRAAPDLAFAGGIVAAAATLYLLPAPAPHSPMLFVRGGIVAVVAGGALLLIYRRRGLPSLPAEPAPAVLREVADEEMGMRPEPV